MLDDYVKDSLLSEFISRTGADPALARDLLDGKDWDLNETLKTYAVLSNLPENEWIGDTVALKAKNTAQSRTQVSSNGGLPRPPPMHRGISRVEPNAKIVKQIQSRHRNSSGESSHGNDRAVVSHFPDNSFYSIAIPDLSCFAKGFREYLERELIEFSTLVALQDSATLNWWSNSLPILYPMVTTGDGNCLLHAASLAMWGFHDRELVLRKALFNQLSNSTHMSAFKRRWKWSQSLINRQSGGLIWSEEEWEKEWASLLQLASFQPRQSRSREGSECSSDNNHESDSGVDHRRREDSGGEQYESLEEFHVFLLANILRRPVIVVAEQFLRDTHGENFAPIPFGGIYLPLECDHHQCHPYPLLLTYDAAHFCALVPMEPPPPPPKHDSPPDPAETRHRTDSSASGGKGDERDYAVPVYIPLTDAGGSLLAVHFTTDPGPEFDWTSLENSQAACDVDNYELLLLLHRYLHVNVIELSHPVAARLQQSDRVCVFPHRSQSEQAIATPGEVLSEVPPKENASLKTKLGRKIKKCFNSNSSMKKLQPPEKSCSDAQLRASVNKTVELLEVDEQKRILVAVVDTRLKPPYYAEMIRNYLENAKLKYQEELRAASCAPCQYCRQTRCRCHTRSRAQTLPKDIKMEQKSVYTNTHVNSPSLSQGAAGARRPAAEDPRRVEERSKSQRPAPPGSRDSAMRSSPSFPATSGGKRIISSTVIHRCYTCQKPVSGGRKYCPSCER